jgi:DNA polymerase II small subunit
VKFIDWINGKAGSPEQREIAKKLGYLFIVGDVVDGVGIYPSQEKDLVIKDVYEQFRVFNEYIKRIPKRVQIIICPGNHDGVRLAEPQPQFSKEFVKELYEMENVTLVSNPSYIRIHAVNGFSGLIVLMYHGYSFDHYCLDVQSLRNAGGYGRVDKVVEFLLKKRHLAPTHGSSLFVPTSKDDMVIDLVPDVITTGHIHNLKTSVYKYVNIITCSCFQRLTGETYAERLGHTPTPGLVPILNIKTRKVNVMNFN